MHQPAEKEQGLRDLFLNLSADELRELEQYFELALEIVEQGYTLPVRTPVDISESISTLKERSNRNLKDQS